MPEECGGVQGQAIFIDTEGSFNTSRLEGSVHFFDNALLFVQWKQLENSSFQSTNIIFLFIWVLFLHRYEPGLHRTL
jgi:hypothetical protein